MRARQGMAIMLRLNRVIDKGVAVAVVGYTDALVATLFAQNGVPASDSDPDSSDVLRQLAALLKREQRSPDIVARYGGEEFVVLLPETNSIESRNFAERVLKRVASYDFGDAGKPVRVTISIGLASFPSERISDGQSLLELADNHLYRAKSEGRNRYRD